MIRYTPICANFAVPQALSMDIIQSDLQLHQITQLTLYNS